MEPNEDIQFFKQILPVEMMSSICIVSREDKDLLDSIKICCERKKNKALVEHCHDGTYKVFSIRQELAN